MTRARIEPCVCGGRIHVTHGDYPGHAVLSHNRSPQHEAWRIGYRAEPIDSILPCPDGLPVMRFSPAERLGREGLG